MNNCRIISRFIRVLLQFAIWITLYRKDCNGHSTIKVVLDKQDVEFSCPMPHTNATCIWKYEDRILFNGYDVFKEQFPKFDVKINRTHCILQATSVRMNVAGSYVCETISSSNKREMYSYELIMLDSNPVCSMLPHNILLEGETLRMQCKVVFRGHLTPVMQYEEIGTGGILKNNVIRQFISSNQEVTSTVAWNVSSSDNGSTFVCNIIFTNTSSPGNMSNNIPGYNYTWNFPVVNVYYYPRIVNVSPKKMYYQLEDVIVCSADGNPKPTYSWKSVDSGFVIDGPNLVVTYNMTWNDGFKYICSASTEIVERNITWRIDSDVLFIHMSNQDSDTKIMLFVAFTAGVVVVALSVTLVSYILYRTKKLEGISVHCSNHTPSEKSSENISFNSKMKNDDGKSSGSRRIQMAVYSEEKAVDVHGCGASKKVEFDPRPLDVRSTQTKQRSSTYTGDDGTVYMELNPLKTSQRRGPHHPYAPPNLQPDKDKLYASIDHTIKPPPFRGGVTMKPPALNPGVQGSSHRKYVQPSGY